MSIVRMRCEVSEDEVIRRWWSLPVGCLLPLSTGAIYRLLFAGYRGSAIGPDVRDAVFSVVSASASAGGMASEQRLVGDVELHVYASAWLQHQHHIDTRYNSVALHVVLFCDDPAPTRCAAGAAIPVCSLNDLPVRFDDTNQADCVGNWPCLSAMSQQGMQARTRLLQQAGLQRFEEKAHAFLEQLRSMLLYETTLAGYDLCLIPALAEGFGYGRDREFFRAVGSYWLGLPVSLPRPLGKASRLSSLDVHRLQVLAVLVERWRGPGLWQTLRAILLGGSDKDSGIRLRKLRQLFGDAGLGLARTDILLCNVVLPFALAVALQERDVILGERARQLYVQHPGLSSNRITRIMYAQLRLPVEPQGSCQQQGLHYIYQQTCREKRCDICVMGRSML